MFQNILFTANTDDADVKLVDFGFSRIYSEQQPLKTPCFTLSYAAPEVHYTDTLLGPRTFL